MTSCFHGYCQGGSCCQTSLLAEPHVPSWIPPSYLCTPLDSHAPSCKRNNVRINDIYGVAPMFFFLILGVIRDLWLVPLYSLPLYTALGIRFDWESFFQEISKGITFCHRWIAWFELIWMLGLTKVYALLTPILNTTIPSQLLDTMTRNGSKWGLEQNITNGLKQHQRGNHWYRHLPYW